MLSGSVEHCTIKLLPWQQYLYEQKMTKLNCFDFAYIRGQYL